MAVSEKKASTKKKPQVRHHMETTVPSVRTCLRCGSWLAAGVAEGIHVQVDLTPLDPGQQAIAVLMRMRLYAYRRTGIVELDALRLTDPRFMVRYPEHRCAVRWPVRAGDGSKLRVGMERGRPVARMGSDSDIPPY